MNEIILSGIALEEPVYSHEVNGERFYEFFFETRRLSETADVLRCVASEVLVDYIHEGREIKIFGDIRTRNIHYKGEEKSRLIVSVFVKDVGDYGSMDEDIVTLEGYVCKEPIYRKTPLGSEICDLSIASNRAYGKSDYIPCIAWGRTARRISGVPVGTKVDITGRLQSRIYKKKVGDSLKERVAYEVSIVRVDIVEIPNTIVEQKGDKE